MKKVLLLVLFGLLVTSCYTVYPVISKTYNYSESISFTIDKVEEGNSIATGNGGSIYVNRGNKFVFVFLTLKNHSEKKQTLDFDNFLLLNPKNKTKHKAEWTMLPGPINIWGKINSYIRKKDKKRRKLVFIFPEEDKAKLLMVNDKIIEIEYAK